MNEVIKTMSSSAHLYTTFCITVGWIVAKLGEGLYGKAALGPVLWLVWCGFWTAIARAVSHEPMR